MTGMPPRRERPATARGPRAGASPRFRRLPVRRSWSGWKVGTDSVAHTPHLGPGRGQGRASSVVSSVWNRLPRGDDMRAGMQIVHNPSPMNAIRGILRDTPPGEAKGMVAVLRPATECTLTNGWTVPSPSVAGAGVWTRAANRRRASSPASRWPRTSGSTTGRRHAMCSALIEGMTNLQIYATIGNTSSGRSVHDHRQDVVMRRIRRSAGPNISSWPEGSGTCRPGTMHVPFLQRRSSIP